MSADNWQVGDLALCIKQGAWRGSISGASPLIRCPKAGQILTVRGVGRGRVASICLWFDGFDGDTIGHSFNAARFRKIRPHTPDQDDYETIELLRGAPVEA